MNNAKFKKKFVSNQIEKKERTYRNHERFKILIASEIRSSSIRDSAISSVLFSRSAAHANFLSTALMADV